MMGQIITVLLALILVNMKHLFTMSLILNIVFIALLLSWNYDYKLDTTQELTLPEILNSKQVYLAGDDMSKEAIQELNLKRIIKGQIQGVTYPTDDGCIIYARTPKNLNDREGMAILGHELLHCYLGEYHTQ